jgi:hypothetical protein
VGRAGEGERIGIHWPCTTAESEETSEQSKVGDGCADASTSLLRFSKSYPNNAIRFLVL